MKKSYLQILIAILFIAGLQLNSATAGDKIKIHLQQPPPNMLGASDLWKLDITNNTKENINVYLTGTATESKKGLIVSGKSKVVSVKPGTTKYGYSDFKNGEVSWNNKSVQESIERTGNVPEGEYTICVTAFFENGEVADQENCIEQKIELGRDIQINLVLPADEAEIDPDTSGNINFIWTSTGPGPFALKIVEMKDNQSSEEAMQRNHSFFEQKEIKETTFPYPLSAPKFEGGKKYAWAVGVNGVFNTIHVYRIVLSGVITTLSLTPYSSGCCDSIYVTTNGNMFNAFRISSGGSVTNTISSAGPDNTTVTPSIITTPVSSVVWSNMPLGTAFQTGTHDRGAVCFTNISGPFTMVVNWSTNGGLTFTGSDTIHVTCPPAPCNCDPVTAIGYDYHPDGSFDPGSTLTQHLSSPCESQVHVVRGSRIFPTTGFTCTGGCGSSVKFDLANSAGINILTDVDAGSILEHKLDSCGNFKLTIHHKCLQPPPAPPIECPDCHLFITVDCQTDTCGCMPQTTMNYDYFPDGSLTSNMLTQHNLSAPCGSYIHVAQGSRIQPIITHSCTGSCSDTVGLVLWNSSFTYIMNWSNPDSLLSYHFNTCDTFFLQTQHYCFTTNGPPQTTCTPCAITIVTECQTDSCGCGDWGQIDYSKNTVTGLIAHCRDTIQATQADMFTFNGHHACTDTCTQTTSTTLYRIGGSILGTQAGLTGSIDFSTIGGPHPHPRPCGLYKAVFKAACGNQQCDSCTLYINVRCDSLHTESICDSLNASAVRNDSGSCCWKIDLSHPLNTTGINGIQFLPASPNSFITGSMHLGAGYTSGWFHQSTTTHNYTIKKPSGNVPTGQLNNFFYFCLNNVSSPETIVVNWLHDTTVVCSKTLTINCDIPCVAFTRDSIICNGNNYSLNYSFVNNSGFSISDIDYSVISPIGPIITPTTTSLSSPVLNNQPSGNINIGISNVSPNTNLCILMRFRSSDGCCLCTDTLCVNIPSCACDQVGAALVGDPYNCCYELSLTNTYAANYFTSVNITSITPGVTIASENYITDWGDMVADLYQMQITMSPSFHIPLFGTATNVGLLCFTGYTTPNQRFLVQWMHDSLVVCVDTLTTNCVPPHIENDSCSQIVNDTIICLGNGTYQYNFQVQNNSGLTTTGFKLNAISPYTLTLSPFDFPNVPMNPGTVSAPQSLIISGAAPGSIICFEIALYNHPDSLYSQCCHSEQICKTLPPCGTDSTDCCGFIVDSAKTLFLSTHPAGSLTFVDDFVVPLPVMITKVKLQILEISLNNVVLSSANILSLLRNVSLPLLNSGVLGDRDFAITSNGNGVWFYNTLHPPTANNPFNGQLSFTGTIINVFASNVNQVRLKLRYTFYKDDGAICEKEVYFHP